MLAALGLGRLGGASHTPSTPGPAHGSTKTTQGRLNGWQSTAEMSLLSLKQKDAQNVLDTEQARLLSGAVGHT